MQRVVLPKGFRAMCDNCDAYIAKTNMQGECHAVPSQPMFAGYMQAMPGPIVAAGGAPGAPPQPRIIGAWAPVPKNEWCRFWQPDEKTLRQLQRDSKLTAEEHTKAEAAEVAIALGGPLAGDPKPDDPRIDHAEGIDGISG